MKGYKILVVDDEQDLCEILKFNLENEGFAVDVAYSAEEAIKHKIENYDLLLLDVMMGKMSGFRLAEKLRKERKLYIPIIFLTAKDTDNDALTGFSLGADDYVSKPFSVRQVIARVKAVLNRTKSTGRKDENIKIEQMEVDVNSKKVKIGNMPVNLTRKEFEILLLLIENQDKVFSREEILDYVWKDDVIVSNRTVDVNITRIRKKLGEYGKALINRSGYGYCFDFNKINLI